MGDELDLDAIENRYASIAWSNDVSNDRITGLAAYQTAARDVLRLLHEVRVQRKASELESQEPSLDLEAIEKHLTDGYGGITSAERDVSTLLHEVRVLRVVQKAAELLKNERNEWKAEAARLAAAFERTRVADRHLETLRDLAGDTLSAKLYLRERVAIREALRALEPAHFAAARVSRAVKDYTAPGSRAVELFCADCKVSDRDDPSVQPRLALGATYCSPCVMKRESVLPMKLDDGEVIFCDSIAGGQAYVEGMPAHLHLTRRLPDGTCYRSMYVWCSPISAHEPAREAASPAPRGDVTVASLPPQEGRAGLSSSPLPKEFVEDPIDVIRSIPGAKVSEPTVLPDGHAFATASFPLPKDHWLTKAGDNVPPMPFRCGTDHPRRREYVEKIEAAARYAVRAATANGVDDDFDPDALVRQVVVGLLGYYTPDGLSSDSFNNPNPVPPLFVELERS